MCRRLGCPPTFSLSLGGEPTKVLKQKVEGETGCPESSPGPDRLWAPPPRQEHQTLECAPAPAPLTEMASLVQVSMMGCSRLSNSFMSSCVSSRSFCICCSSAWATAAVTCSWKARGRQDCVRRDPGPGTPRLARPCPPPAFTPEA